MAQGFGLGVSAVTDPKSNAWMGMGSRRAFGWPGLFGGWWQVDPERQMVMLRLQQTLPPQAPPGNTDAMGDSRMAETLAPMDVFFPQTLLSKMAQRSGKAPRMPGIAAIQSFQKETHAALAALA